MESSFRGVGGVPGDVSEIVRRRSGGFTLPINVLMKKILCGKSYTYSSTEMLRRDSLGKKRIKFQIPVP